MKSFLKLIARSLYSGFSIGFLGLVLGYFGPLVFNPEANQGPLLGIFFTGPIGFLIGLTAGFINGIFKNKSYKAQKSENRVLDIWNRIVIASWVLASIMIVFSLIYLKN